MIQCILCNTYQGVKCMESVEWIFSDHKLHLSMLQLLREEQHLFSKDASNDASRDVEISGMVLAPPTLEGMPHVHATGSSTEWAVMKLNMINQDRQTLANEIQRYSQLLRLYDAVIRTTNDDECWFIKHYYDDGHSLSSLPSLPSLPDSPFCDLSRSTMSNDRKRLLQKAAEAFNMNVNAVNDAA